MPKKVFVSGCYDLLHSGHVEFFKEAAEYGELYVGIGSDSTIEGYKGHKPMFPEQERLFMVKAVRYVKDAFINAGSGVMDFLPTLDIVKPDVLVVNAEGGSEQKRLLCEERGMEYVVLQRNPAEGLEARSSSGLKKALASAAETESSSGSGANRAGVPGCSGQGSGCSIPTRLDLAGTWIDQPYVSQHCPGWALTISLNPTFEVRERCGLSTSTRNQIRRIWPVHLPKMDPEMLARLVFCFENHPEREGGHISGAQDAIGICVPGLCRHYYDGHFWPEKIEICSEASVLWWLEQHLCLIPLEPRKLGCSVVEGKNITLEKVRALASAAECCWTAILSKNLEAFAAAYKASFEAQVAMFPGMVEPTIRTGSAGSSTEPIDSHSVRISLRPEIDKWASEEGVLAWKFPGAGGGGYLALVVTDATPFCLEHPEAIPLHIRRD